MKPIPKLDEASLKRFWRYVDKSGGPNSCWEWLGARNIYGVFGIDYNLYYTHRISWTITHSDPKHLYVLHKCDNPPCVNPSHLFLGTSSDNSKDMVEKGRQNAPKGEDHYASGLSDIEVMEVRLLQATGDFDQDVLAEMYGIVKATIHDLVTGKTRKDAKGPISFIGRGGSHNGASKLNEKQVKEIRNKYESKKYTQVALAESYDVCDRTIWGIVNRKTWTHI